MKDDSKSADDIVIECDLPHPPEHVWHAITDQDLLGQWLAPSDLRPEVGARFRLPSSQATQNSMIDCEVIEAIPSRMLRWRQTERVAENDTTSIESLVTFELFPNTAGTHLRISHDHFRRIETRTQASITNAARMEPRKKYSQAARRSTPKIVCTLNTLRKAA